MSKTKRTEGPVKGHEDIGQEIFRQVRQNMGFSPSFDKAIEMAFYLSRHIGRVRVWEDTPTGRVKIKELPFAEFDLRKMEGFEETGDSDLLLDFRIEGKRLTAVNMKNEPAIIGQDISEFETEINKMEVNEPGRDLSESDLPFEEQFISVDEAARFLDVANSTVTRRIKSHEMLGFRNFKKKWRIPKEQFDGQNVVRGIPEMIKMFDYDHGGAWLFLSSHLYFGSTAPRPIDRLRALKTKAELSACLDKLEADKSSYVRGDHF